MSQALHLLIHGRVQGVFFRGEMTKTAARHGATGWVRNRRDGSVEAVIIGSAQAVAAVALWAQRGPPTAQVERVEQRAAMQAEIAQAGAHFSQLPGA